MARNSAMAYGSESDREMDVLLINYVLLNYY